MSKLLLYCNKVKPYIMKYKDGKYKEIASFYNKQDLETYDLLNGKIVAECDFEVEEIINCDTSFMIMKYDDLQESYNYTNKIARDSCLNYNDLRRYLGTNNGYAIHIKNLHIFDTPKELSDYYKFDGIYNDINNWKTIDKAPQNMMYAYDLISELGFSGTYNMHLKKNILISIKPQWMCLILNRIKDVEVRRKVLKEMLENE